jgi:hypothetical protein
MLVNLSFLLIVMVTGAFCVLFTNLLKEIITALAQAVASKKTTQKT